MSRNGDLEALAELAVAFGANVQPGQIVAVSSEAGKEPLARAIASAAYRHGARFVDVNVFDPHVKRARLLHADPETLGFVPSWYGERVRRLGDERAALIALTGPVEPGLMEGIDPALLGRDLLPRLRESGPLVEERLVNWTVVPCPTRGWAAQVHPDATPDAALERLWDEVARVCRLRDGDPIAAWSRRLDRLAELSVLLTELALDAVRLEGPGTDLTVGLLAGARWTGGRLASVDGIVHVPNLPTEEVFTTPDPRRVDGTVSATKPLVVSGGLVEGLRIRFSDGRAVEVEADRGAETVRALVARDEGAARLGELALVDRESGVGAVGTVFYDTLLDENAASHLALGRGFPFLVDDPVQQERVNQSDIHVDFMVGSEAVEMTGLRAGGEPVALLRAGAWQI